MPTLLLRTYHGSKILQFVTGSSFLLKIHIIFYCQYVKFRNAAYEKVRLDLLHSSLKNQAKGPFVDKFCNLSFCAFNHLKAQKVAAKVLATCFI